MKKKDQILAGILETPPGYLIDSFYLMDFQVEFKIEFRKRFSNIHADEFLEEFLKGKFLKGLQEEIGEKLMR